MKRNIRELTPFDAEEILEYYYPNKTKLSNPKNFDYWFLELLFGPIINPDGSQQVTMGMLPMVGITYHNDQDRCLLPFNNTKVIYWLYTHDFDVSEQLKQNQYLSEQENDFDNFAFEIIQYSKGDSNYRGEAKKNRTLENLEKQIGLLANKYWYDK